MKEKTDMNESFMKEKPVFPLLVSMALPMVISMLVQIMLKRNASSATAELLFHF